MIDRAIGILGIALAIIFGVAALEPKWWPEVPLVVAFSGVLVGVLLIGVAAGMLLSNYRKIPSFVDTAELQIHVYADTRMPTRLSHSNIWRWYFMKQVLVQLNRDTGAEDRRNITSTLFLTFDAPVNMGTLEVSSPDMQLPMHEVKDFNSRSAIIFFNADVPEGTLAVRVHQ